MCSNRSARERRPDQGIVSEVGRTAAADGQPLFRERIIRAEQCI